MPFKANISPGYLWRLALVAALCLFMAGWFLFDGLWTYPRQRVRALEYQRLKAEDRLGEWKSMAQEHGWPADDPGEPKTQAQTITQLVFAGLLTPPGLIFLFRFLRMRKRWVESTETGLRTSWGRQLLFNQITALNKRQWDKKGIAKVVYRQDGRTRRLVLDDWKFETAPTKSILREVESHIDVEQIVGGAPELPEECERHICG